MLRKFSPKDLFALFACGVLTLRGPITAWILPFDGACRISAALLIMAVIWEFKEIRKLFRLFPVSIYFALAIYMFFNGYFKGAYSNLSSSIFTILNFLFFDALSAPLSMLLAIRLLSVDFSTTVKFETFVLLLYGVLALLFSSVNDVNRLQGAGNVNGNIVALNMVVCSACALLLYMYRRVSIWFVGLVIVFSILLILLTACRMAVAMLVIISFFITFYYLFRGNFIKKSYSIIIFCLISIALLFLMKYTTVGERLSMTAEQSEGTGFETGTFLDKFGDRGAQYYFSWPYFLDHPVTGIGFRMWGRNGNYGYRAHSEYMTLYVENGLIALALWLLFLVSIFKSSFLCLKSNVPKFRSSALIVCAFLCSLIFAYSVIWTYDSAPIFFIYSVAIVLPVLGRSCIFKFNYGSKTKI